MARDWRRIELSCEQIRAGELEQIRAQFSVFCMTGATTADVAIFTRRTKTGGSEVYFSPAALPYAEFVFERHPPCASNRPVLLGTTLLVGRHAASQTCSASPRMCSRSARPPSNRPTVDVSFLQPDNTKASGN